MLSFILHLLIQQTFVLLCVNFPDGCSCTKLPLPPEGLVTEPRLQLTDWIMIQLLSVSFSWIKFLMHRPLIYLAAGPLSYFMETLTLTEVSIPDAKSFTVAKIIPC